jgi:hypothetical protein
MRWHVHGTDAATGVDVEFSLNEPQREQAIKIAIDRGILVSHVTAGRARGSGKLLRTLTAFTLISLACASVGLVTAISQANAKNANLRGMLDQAMSDQSRLAQSVANAERAAVDIRATGNLAVGASEQIQKLADDLATARSRVSLTEQQLTVKNRHINELEAAYLRLPEVEAQAIVLSQQVAAARAQLAESELTSSQLRSDMLLQARRMAQLETLPSEANAAAREKISQLETANAQLATDLEKMKDELLVAVAKAHAAATAPVVEPATPQTPASWSLRISYEDAQKFLALHTDPSSVLTRAVGTDGEERDSPTLFTSSGSLTDNVLRLRFTHDREKEHVYSAAVVVPALADAPAERAEENARLIAAFLKEFVPGVRDPEAIVAKAMKQAPSLTEEHRALFLEQDCKVQAWTTKAGLVTFQIDASRDSVEP